jgi:release factor glutamine methyltransferase
MPSRRPLAFQQRPSLQAFAPGARPLFPLQFPRRIITAMASLLGPALRDTAAALRNAGVEEPEREAVALAAWALAAPVAAILAHPERRLSEEEDARLHRAVNRRAAREPLAYVTGRKEFYGLELLVDRRVIVPRPETEHVVEQALAIARSFERPVIADIGTGSGCIAVALAHNLERALLYAADSSAEALEVAAANVGRHNLEQRVRLLRGDLLRPLPEPVHIIASNPPYIASGDFPALMPEVRDYEPRGALDGGGDGLAVIRRLIDEAPQHLRDYGALVMEIGADQAPRVLALARTRFSEARMEADLASFDRVLVARV